MSRTIYRVVLLLSVIAGAIVTRPWDGGRASAEPAELADPSAGGISSASAMPSVVAHAHRGVADRGSSPPHSIAGSVRISLEQQQLIGVRTSPVEKAPGTYTLRVFGRVAPDETRIYNLNAGGNGFIRDVSSITTGSLVQKDQWLATFSAPEAATSIQAYLVTLDIVDRATANGADTPAQMAAAEAGSEQALDRLLNLGMSRLQIEEIKQTRQAPTTIRILAPAEGFVLARNVSLGQKFERGTEWYRIAALDRVWILADVFEADAQYLQPGIPARVSLPRRTESFSARVSEVLPQFDPATRTLKLRLEMNNPGYALRPGMFVDVELPITLPPAVAVPIGAVVDSGLRQTVFVCNGVGLFEPRQVETGWRFGDQVEITNGLTPGESIAVSSTFFLDSESRMSPPVANTGAPNNLEPSGEHAARARRNHAGH